MCDPSTAVVDIDVSAPPVAADAADASGGDDDGTAVTISVTDTDPDGLPPTLSSNGTSTITSTPAPAPAPTPDVLNDAGSTIPCWPDPICFAAVILLSSIALTSSITDVRLLTLVVHFILESTDSLYDHDTSLPPSHIVVVLALHLSPNFSNTKTSFLSPNIISTFFSFVVAILRTKISSPPSLITPATDDISSVYLQFARFMVR